MKRRPPFKCSDCGYDNPQWFFVKQSVWEEAGFRGYDDGLFCLSCFSKLLKRPMTLDDFDDNGPCSNDAIKFMYELGVNAPKHFSIISTVCKW
jgi:hypothetical protein